MCLCNGQVSPVHDHFVAHPDHRPVPVESFVDLTSDPLAAARSRAYQGSNERLR